MARVVGREAPPAWARPTEAVSGNKITPAQRQYLLDLIAKKQYSDPNGKVDIIMKCLRISEDPEELGMTKTKASELIEWFKAKPNKPTPEPQSKRIDGNTPLALLPPGRYALPKAGTKDADNELRFYQCWESRDKVAKRLYVMFGPYDSKLPFAAQQAIAQKILLNGVRECAIRYGMEIRECSNCGRRLTNRISRELGIGPVCGGRMFGDDFKPMVTLKRDEITARGQDPDEELND